MRTSPKSYTITEFGGFTQDLEHPTLQRLPKDTFEALENFVLANGDESNPTQFFNISARRGYGKVITARNYVGVVTLSDGTVIEVLPKIAGVTNEQPENSAQLNETRTIFMDMLRYLGDVKFKSSNHSQLNTKHFTLFEVFIEMFLSEVTRITQQGLKSSYVTVEQNEQFYRGKLLTSENIRHNTVRRDRFFIQYDEMSLDRPENRLLKSTLLLLRTLTRSGSNRQTASRLLTFFDGVRESSNYSSDFSKCTVTRGMHHYRNAIEWARVFLYKKSFTTFTGSNVALALLFPMETVFESFIAAKLRQLAPSTTIVRAQDKTHSLFDLPDRLFNLRPDIVLETDTQTVVMDTKWKVLTSERSNFGIDQADMYQMYAYAKKYNAKDVVLVYPATDRLTGDIAPYIANDGVTVTVRFVDLRDADASLRHLLTHVAPEAA